MSDRTDQLLAFYRRERVEDQVGFYRRRREAFDRAVGQAAGISAILLGFATAVSALAGTDLGSTALWAALATVLPAAATALTAYTSVYAFEQQGKIYGDAVQAVRAAARLPGGAGSAVPGDADTAAAELVRRVEAALRQEQAQWGQLTSQIEIPDETKG